MVVVTGLNLVQVLKRLQIIFKFEVTEQVCKISPFQDGWFAKSFMLNASTMFYGIGRPQGRLLFRFN